MSQIYFFTGLDGTSFEEFQRQFRVVAAINKWQEDDLALILGSYLQGPALAFLKSVYKESIDYRKICDIINNEFPANIDYTEIFYTAQQEHIEDVITYFYRLSHIAAKAEIDEQKFIKRFLNTVSMKYKLILGTRIYKSKADLRAILLQLKELFYDQGCDHPCTTTGMSVTVPYGDAGCPRPSSSNTPIHAHQDEKFFTPRYNLTP